MTGMTLDQLLAMEAGLRIDRDYPRGGFKTTLRVTPDRGGHTTINQDFPRYARGFQPGATVANKVVTMGPRKIMAPSFANPAMMCAKDKILTEVPQHPPQAKPGPRKRILDPLNVYGNPAEIRMVLGTLRPRPVPVAPVEPRKQNRPTAPPTVKVPAPYQFATVQPRYAVGARAWDGQGSDFGYVR